MINYSQGEHMRSSVLRLSSICLLVASFVGCNSQSANKQEAQNLQTQEAKSIAKQDAQKIAQRATKLANEAKELEGVKTNKPLLSQLEEVQANIASLQKLLEPNVRGAVVAQATQTRSAAIGGAAAAAIIAFEVKTIPDRIKLGLRIIEAITQGAQELKDTKQAYIDRFALKITMAVADMINPLSDTKTMYATLGKAIDEVLKAPKQGPQDFANIHLRQDLDNLLHKFRFYKFNVTKNASQAINAKLDDVVLKATGVRLNPFATVAEIKFTINQVAKAAKDAEANKMPADFTPFSGKKVTWDKIKKDFEQVKKNFKIGIDAGKMLLDLAKTFAEMAKNGGNIVVGGNKAIDFDFASIPGRIIITTKVAQAIALGTGEYAKKVQRAHTKLGFAVTTALIDAANPFAKAGDVENAIKGIDAALEYLKNAPDMSPTDIANVHYKERMAIKLREYRTYQFGKFVYKTKEQIDGFNKAVLKATGVRLDPYATVQNVDDTLKALASMVKKIEQSQGVLSSDETANFWQKNDLLNTINKAFFTIKSRLNADEKKAMWDAIWNARSVHLDINAKIADVVKTKATLESFIAKASK